MTDYLEAIYLDVWNWITPLFPTYMVVSGYQNGVPLPKNAIVMTVILETSLDQTSTTVDENGVATIFDSIQCTVQVDCYGEKAHAIAREISTRWKSPVTCDAMENIVPLNARNPKDLTFVNETGQYELRFMTELELQYNTSYKQTLQSTDAIDFAIIGI